MRSRPPGPRPGPPTRTCRSEGLRSEHRNGPDHHGAAQYSAPGLRVRPPRRPGPVTRAARALIVTVCAAGPAAPVGVLVATAQERGWTVRVVATPAPRDFLDLAAIEAQTGSPVRSRYRRPGEPRSQPADAIIVAPATFNTIN